MEYYVAAGSNRLRDISVSDDLVVRRAALFIVGVRISRLRWRRLVGRRWGWGGGRAKGICSCSCKHQQEGKARDNRRLHGVLLAFGTSWDLLQGARSV